MRFKKYFTISNKEIDRKALMHWAGHRRFFGVFDKYGVRATKDAYGISRSTIYGWKKKYKDSKYNPKSLIPKSKRPKHTNVNIELNLKKQGVLYVIKLNIPGK